MYDSAWPSGAVGGFDKLLTSTAIDPLAGVNTLSQARDLVRRLTQDDLVHLPQGSFEHVALTVVFIAYASQQLSHDCYEILDGLSTDFHAGAILDTDLMQIWERFFAASAMPAAYRTPSPHVHVLCSGYGSSEHR